MLWVKEIKGLSNEVEFSQPNYSRMFCACANYFRVYGVFVNTAVLDGVMVMKY